MEPHHSMNEKMTNKKKDSAAAAADSEEDAASVEDDKRKRAASGSKRGGGGGDASMKSCQAEKCSADLSDAKTYHRRHKVCEVHAKAQVVVVAGIRQRFCQQCSRFHEVSEFDEAKRSCRRRLAGHNERRRKNPSDSNSQGEGSGRGSRSNGQVDDRGRIPMTIQENANYKHYHVR